MPTSEDDIGSHMCKVDLWEGFEGLGESKYIITRDQWDQVLPGEGIISTCRAFGKFGHLQQLDRQLK